MNGVRPIGCQQLYPDAGPSSPFPGRHGLPCHRVQRERYAINAGYNRTCKCRQNMWCRLSEQIPVVSDGFRIAATRTCGGARRILQVAGDCARVLRDLTHRGLVGSATRFSDNRSDQLNSRPPRSNTVSRLHHRQQVIFDRFGQAGPSFYDSLQIGAFSAPTAAPRAAPSRECVFCSGFTGVAY